MKKESSVEIPTRCSFVIEFIIPNFINFGIINSITQLHIVGISTEPFTMHGSINIQFINAKQARDVHSYKNTKRKLYKTNSAIWFNINFGIINSIYKYQI
jgi:hypothetical protein